MSGEIPLPYAKRISLKMFLSVIVSSLMEDGYVDIGQKMYPSRRCLRFSRLTIRSSFVIFFLSSSSVLRCCSSLMYIS